MLTVMLPLGYQPWLGLIASLKAWLMSLVSKVNIGSFLMSARTVDQSCLGQVTVTIDILPDNALLEIFSFYLVGKANTGEWHMLANICQRWQGLVFVSPRCLDVQLVCTARTQIEDILAAWSGLPLLVLWDSEPELSQLEGADNIIAALRYKIPVCQIKLNGHSTHLLRRIVEVIREPFPALSHVGIRSLDDAETAVVFPNEILGGSTPSLRSCSLRSIAFPGIWKLLLTTDHLVNLCLKCIPSCTYISSKGMVDFLSALSHLKMLTIQFQCPWPWESIQSLPLETRVVLHSLTYIWIHGDCKYSKDLCSWIDVPLLDFFCFIFFTVKSHTLQLHNFLNQTETCKQSRRLSLQYMKGLHT